MSNPLRRRIRRTQSAVKPREPRPDDLENDGGPCQKPTAGKKVLLDAQILTDPVGKAPRDERPGGTQFKNRLTTSRTRVFHDSNEIGSAETSFSVTPMV